MTTCIGDDGARAGQNMAQPVLGRRRMCLCAGVQIAWPGETKLCVVVV